MYRKVPLLSLSDEYISRFIPGEGMTGMANHAKHSEYDAFGKCVNNVSDSICGLCEGVAQASYLVAISEATSNTANKGLIDQTQFSRAASAIKHACNTLTNPSTTQQQVNNTDCNIIMKLLISQISS